MFDFARKDQDRIMNSLNIGVLPEGPSEGEFHEISATLCVHGPKGLVTRQYQSCLQKITIHRLALGLNWRCVKVICRPLGSHMNGDTLCIRAKFQQIKNPLEIKEAQDQTPLAIGEKIGFSI